MVDIVVDITIVANVLYVFSWQVISWPTVFCKEKGYPDVIGASQVGDANISPGIGNIYLQNGGCDSETIDTIYRCRKVYGSSGCSHNEDMAVNCDRKHDVIRLTKV